MKATSALGPQVACDATRNAVLDWSALHKLSTAWKKQGSDIILRNTIKLLNYMNTCYLLLLQNWILQYMSKSISNYSMLFFQNSITEIIHQKFLVDLMKLQLSGRNFKLKLRLSFTWLFLILATVLRVTCLKIFLLRAKKIELET